MRAECRHGWERPGGTLVAADQVGEHGRPMAEKTEKTDFKKSLDSYQAKRGRFRILEVP